MSTSPDSTINASEEADNPLFHLVHSYGRPYWSYFSLGLLTQTLEQIPNWVPGLVIGVAFDAVFLQSAAYSLPLVPEAWIPETRMGQFWFTVALIIGSYVISIPLSVLSRLSYGWFNLYLLYDVRTDTYDAMQRLSMEFFDSEQTGEVMSILNNDVQNLQSFTRGTLSQTIQMPLSVVITFGFMAWVSWQLALVLLFVPVLIPLISHWYANVIRPVHEEARARIGSLNAQLQNNISGVATIKANAAEEREIERVEAVGRKRRDMHIQQSKYGSAVRPAVHLVRNIGILSVIVIGGYWILEHPPGFFSGSLTAGALVTFIMYARSFVGPLRRLTGIVDNYENAKASAARIVDLLADPDVIPEADDAIDLDRTVGRVEYDDISFAYEGADEWTLQNITFRAEPGEMVGIVGPTGAGKSTLPKLLARFYDVDEGAIRTDGHDIRGITLRSLRRQLGYVGQEPFLFHGSVAENIAYGVANVGEAEIAKAAERAGAHEFVQKLPDGYDTIVGERGMKLSGGQRQRLAIARAIVRDPAILILDEATSHVDNETEAVIQRNLEDLIENRTTFVIAHRLSTVRNADCILVLNDGEIVERGTHDELLEQDGLYANLWRVQVGDIASLPEEFIEQTRRRQLEGSK